MIPVTSNIVWAVGGVVVDTAYAAEEARNDTVERYVFTEKGDFLAHFGEIWEHNKKKVDTPKE